MKPEDKRHFTVLPDWKLLGFNIYREAAGEPREGRIGVGTVTLERVDHRDWDGKTIQEVILKKWQFSWTMPEADEAYYEESVDMAANFDQEYAHNVALVECCRIAREMLQGDIPRDPELAAAHCTEYVAAKYRKFMDEHPAVKGNRWWQRMKLLKTIGGHEFYIKGGVK